MATARSFGERIHYPDSNTGNSGHFYIERTGEIQQWVPLERVAHHVRGFNACSIGIELDNPGRYPNWLDSRFQKMTTPYTRTQLDSLTDLLKLLENQLPSLRRICGHEMLDDEQVPASDNPELRVYRKRDPGPLFPWQDVLSITKLEIFDPRTP